MTARGALLLPFTALLLASGSSADATDYEPPAYAAAAWLSSHQNPDGSWGGGVERRMHETLEAVQALRATGSRDAAYHRGIAWLESRAAANLDHVARRVGALVARGDDVSADLATLAAVQAGAQSSGWGLADAYRAAAFDTAIVVRGLAGSPGAVDVAGAVAHLTAMQLPDSGWSLGSATTPDPFTTALVALALAPHADADPSVADVVAQGLAILAATVGSGSAFHVEALAAMAALEAGDAALAVTWLDSLAATQDGEGGFGGAYATALAAQAFARAAGLDASDAQLPVSVPDAKLRSAMNGALGRNALDGITRGELARLVTLDASGLGIADLTGLEHAVNLVFADLSHNEITDTTPLEALGELPDVILIGNPLAGLSVPASSPWAVIVALVLLVGTGIVHARRAGGLGAGAVLFLLGAAMVVPAGAEERIREESTALEPRVHARTQAVGRALLAAKRSVLADGGAKVLRADAAALRAALARALRPSGLVRVPPRAPGAEHGIAGAKPATGDDADLAELSSVAHRLVRAPAPRRARGPVRFEPPSRAIGRVSRARLDGVARQVLAALDAPEAERTSALARIASTLRFRPPRGAREPDPAPTPTLTVRSTHRQVGQGVGPAPGPVPGASTGAAAR